MSTNVKLGANQIVDFLEINNANYTSTEKTLLTTTTEDLAWTDYNEALAICNYNNSVNSSYLGQFDTLPIDKITIQKKKAEDSIYKVIGTFSPSQLNCAEDIRYYEIKDFNVANNVNYKYSLLLNTFDNTVETPLYSEILTNWEEFSITPLIYNAENGIYTLYEENNIPVVWNFLLNCTEGSLTYEQDKTILTTFAKYPKYYYGDLNYKVGNFSALLGGISVSNNYYEPTELLSKWNKLIESNCPCLFKNIKGDSFIIAIDTNSTIEYDNKASNYTVEDNRVTTYPTQINIKYTVINKAEDCVILRSQDIQNN